MSNVILSTLGRRRSTSFYYYAWRLTQNARQRRHVLSDIIQRNLLRSSDNYLELSESEFKKRYRLNKSAFKFQCQQLRAKTNLKSTQRISLDQMVLCALSFYATGSYQRLVGMGGHLGQTTVSKYVNIITNALNNARLANNIIKFPKTRAERDIIQQKFFTKYHIPGICGCVDGSHFHIVKPAKEIEHLFYCRKHFHSLNVQIVCDSDYKILNVNTKYGGATHDAFIWENSQTNLFMQELHGHHEQVWLLGDSGYPQRPWLMTPIPDAAEGSPEARYTMLHGKARVVIENTFGRLKNRWRCLHKDRTLHYTPKKCAKIITACCVLHNIAVQFGVPDPEDDTDLTNEATCDHPFITVESGSQSQGELIRGRALRSALVQRLTNVLV